VALRLLLARLFVAVDGVLMENNLDLASAKGRFLGVCALIQLLDKLALAAGLEPDDSGGVRKRRIGRLYAALQVLADLAVEVAVPGHVRSTVQRFDDARRVLSIVVERVEVLRCQPPVTVIDHRPIVLVLHLVFHDLLEYLAVGIATTGAIQVL
jgi:hypothetical protein